VKNILIIGATSAIAKATARIWAASGYRIFLVARDLEQLDSLISDLKIRGAVDVRSYCMDINSINDHTKMFDEVIAYFHVVDIVLIAHGTLSDQAACEASIDLTLHEIKTNALSVIALMMLIANYFERKKEGVLAVISSVSGDRGRATNYVYGSAKAMVSTFASGLRQRLWKSNVAIVTIKPGFVDTPMTAKFKKGFLWAKPKLVAAGIVGAINRRASIVYLPSYWRIIMIVIVLIPEFLYKKIKKL